MNPYPHSMMRQVIAWTGIAVMLAAVPISWGQENAQPSRKQPKTGTSLKPTHANVVYGKHERHVLDFWRAKSEKPTPLALFIHGGGFTRGSKEGLNPRELQELLDAGISVASINYRLLEHAPLPAAHQDATRAVQFLRSKASDWNLDKTRVGGFGASAGAQLVMYLAFHDDLAQPDSTDPVARESSRLSCVAPSRGQTNLTSRPRAPEVFGTSDSAATKKIIADIAAVSLISKDDPPVFMRYSMAPDDATKTNPIHHVSYGVELKKLCDKLGVECHLLYPGAKSDFQTDVQFLKAKLLGITK